MKKCLLMVVLLSLFSFFGVMASEKPLENVKKEWVIRRLLCQREVQPKKLTYPYIQGAPNECISDLFGPPFQCLKNPTIECLSDPFIDRVNELLHSSGFCRRGPKS